MAETDISVNTVMMWRSELNVGLVHVREIEMLPPKLENNQENIEICLKSKFSPPWEKPYLKY